MAFPVKTRRRLTLKIQCEDSEKVISNEGLTKKHGPDTPVPPKKGEEHVSKNHRPDTPVPPKKGEKKVPKSKPPPPEYPEHPLQNSRYSDEKSERRKKWMIACMKRDLKIEIESGDDSTFGPGLSASYTLMVYELTRRHVNVTRDAFSHDPLSNLEFLINYLDEMDHRGYEHGVDFYDLSKIYEWGARADYMRSHSGPYHKDLPRVMDIWFRIVKKFHKIHTRAANSILERGFVTFMHFDWFTHPVEEMKKIETEMKSVLLRSKRQ